MELKSKKCHGGIGYKDKVMVLLSCNADGNRKLHPLIVKELKNYTPLKGCDITEMITNHTKSHRPPVDR
jgi:hypothetical protein